MNVQETVGTPIVAKAINSATYAAAGSALAFGLTANELGVLASVAIGACTFIAGTWLNYHFRQKHFKLVEAYVKSGDFDRRRTERREDVCSQCPLVKHPHDHDCG